MNAISSISGVRYAHAAPKVGFKNSPGQIPPFDPSGEENAVEGAFSLGAEASVGSVRESMEKVSNLQTMMETLKKIESRTHGYRSFAERLLNQDTSGEDAKLGGSPNAFAEVNDYLCTQVGLLMGQVQAKDSDLITLLKNDIKLDSSFARDLGNSVAEQLLQGLNIVLDIDAHERVRIAKLLRNDI